MRPIVAAPSVARSPSQGCVGSTSAPGTNGTAPGNGETATTTNGLKSLLRNNNKKTQLNGSNNGNNGNNGPPNGGGGELTTATTVPPSHNNGIVGAANVLKAKITTVAEKLSPERRKSSCPPVVVPKAAVPPPPGAADQPGTTGHEPSPSKSPSPKLLNGGGGSTRKVLAKNSKSSSSEDQQQFRDINNNVELQQPAADAAAKTVTATGATARLPECNGSSSSSSNRSAAADTVVAKSTQDGAPAASCDNNPAADGTAPAIDTAKSSRPVKVKKVIKKIIVKKKVKPKSPEAGEAAENGAAAVAVPAVSKKPTQEPKVAPKPTTGTTGTGGSESIGNGDIATAKNKRQTSTNHNKRTDEGDLRPPPVTTDGMLLPPPPPASRGRPTADAVTAAATRERESKRTDKRPPDVAPPAPPVVAPLEEQQPATKRHPGSNHSRGGKMFENIFMRFLRAEETAVLGPSSARRRNLPARSRSVVDGDRLRSVSPEPGPPPADDHHLMRSPFPTEPIPLNAAAMLSLVFEPPGGGLAEKTAASNYLTSKINDFLRRTDHWRGMGRRMMRDSGVDDGYGGGGTRRSKSVSNIIARGLQLLKTQPAISRSSSRASNLTVRSEDEDDRSTLVDISELSDITAELNEEHSSSNLISERLEGETTERLRLEREVKDYEHKYRDLQESSEKLEMELLCAKSELNCDFDDDIDNDNDHTGAANNGYRLKYERVARELDFTKKRLQTQHEHDLEQLVGLKKQLEKKLSDAYEEVEEQRQVVAQWKKKAQKMTNEMNDLRMLYEEQNSRNNLLEKRQRKFDSECQALQDTARQEKQAKERLIREKDVLIAEKCTLEQTVSDLRLELDLKEEKNVVLRQELEEMTFGGGTEEEIAQLKRQKLELDRRCKEQEEELDEMAGQIQLLEQAKLRLEMSLENNRKEARKEAQQRDDEMEEIRGSSYKKVKSLECQLEQEHEERTLLLREKHELERRLNTLEDQDRAERAADEALLQKLKRDARKYKALLRDAQSQLERAKGDSASKALLRQLRNQLEDAESSRSIAVKARQALEVELQDVQLMYEESVRGRNEAEEKATVAQRDRTELQAQIDENDEEMAELMKKYSATVKQLSSEQSIIAEFEIKVSELETEKKSLKEQILELSSRLENVENIGDSSSSMQFKRMELRTKEIESRLEFEQATRARLEVQLNRHKDSLEKVQSEMHQLRNKESLAQESLKKSLKTNRELREEVSALANKEHESTNKRKDFEKLLETSEAETASVKSDLKLALQRIADLQQAMEEGDSYHSDSDSSESSLDSLVEPNTRRSAASIMSETSSLSNGRAIDREKHDSNPRITLTTASSTSSRGTGAAAVLAANGSDPPGDSSFA